LVVFPIRPRAEGVPRNRIVTPENYAQLRLIGSGQYLVEFFSRNFIGIGDVA
jgi:hypothetical protein